MTVECVDLPYVINWYRFAKYNILKMYLQQNAEISHIGKTFIVVLTPVLTTFSIKLLFFRVDLKHLASHLG